MVDPSAQPAGLALFGVPGSGSGSRGHDARRRIVRAEPPPGGLLLLPRHDGLAPRPRGTDGGPPCTARRGSSAGFGCELRHPGGNKINLDWIMTSGGEIDGGRS